MAFKNYCKFMHSHIRRHFPLYIAVLFVSIVLSLSALVNPIISQYIIDNILIAQNSNLIYDVAIVIVLLFIGIAGINVLHSFLQSLLLNRLNYQIKLDFFDHLQRSAFFENLSKYSGEIYYRMFKDGTVLTLYYSKLCIDCIMNSFMIITIVFIMCSWSVLLTCCTILMVTLQIIIVSFFRKPLGNIVNQQRTIEQDLAAYVNQTFLETETTKLMGLEELKYQDAKNKFNSVVRISVKNVFISGVIKQISSFSNQVWSAVLLIIGSILAVNGQLYIGTLMAFYMLINYFYTPALLIVGLFTSYPETRVSFKRFLEYYDHVDPSYFSDLPFAFNKESEMQDITFSYDKSHLVLSKLCLHFYRGEFVVLTGVSGSGKSTIVRLISRLLIPQEGRILLDGIDISKINLKEFRNFVGVLPQSPVLLNTTLRSNITLDRDQFSDIQIQLILEKVGLGQYTKDLDLLFGVKGKSLSIGEIQRLVLARILIRKLEILILDEPTAAVDKHTEQFLMKCLLEYQKMQNAFILVITHSENMADFADRIICVSDLTEIKA